MGRKSTKPEIPWKNKLQTIEGFEGFVYEITYKPTGQKYIGKKSYWSRRRIKVKGRKNRKRVLKESNWKKYTSSNSWIKERVKEEGVEKFEFKILKHCKSKRELTYWEVAYQFKENVLLSKDKDGNYKYINDNILGKFFRTHIEQ